MISIIKSGEVFNDDDSETKVIPVSGRIVKIVRIRRIPIESNETEVKDMDNEYTNDELDFNQYDEDLNRIPDDVVDHILSKLESDELADLLDDLDNEELDEDDLKALGFDEELGEIEPDELELEPEEEEEPEFRDEEDDFSGMDDL